MTKDRWKSAGDRLNDFVDHSCRSIQQSIQSNRSGRGKQCNQGQCQKLNTYRELITHAYTESANIMRQSGNRTGDECKYKNQTHN